MLLTALKPWSKLGPSQEGETKARPAGHLGVTRRKLRGRHNSGLERGRALKSSQAVHQTLFPHAWHTAWHKADPTVESQILTSLPAEEMTQWATNLLKKPEDQNSNSQHSHSAEQDWNPICNPNVRETETGDPRSKLGV